MQLKVKNETIMIINDKKLTVINKNDKNDYNNINVNPNNSNDYNNIN